MSKNPYFAHLPTWRNRQDLAYALDSLPKILATMTASSPLIATYSYPSTTLQNSFSNTSSCTLPCSSSTPSSTTTPPSRPSSSPSRHPAFTAASTPQAASVFSRTPSPYPSSFVASPSSSIAAYSPSAFRERFVLDLARECQRPSSPTSSSSTIFSSPSTLCASRRASGMISPHGDTKTATSNDSNSSDFNDTSTDDHLFYPLQFSTRAKAMAFLIEVLQSLQKEPCGCDLTKGCNCGADGVEDHEGKAPCYVCGEWFSVRKDFNGCNSSGDYGQALAQARSWHEKGSLRHHVAESRVKKWLDLVWRPPMTPATTPEQEAVKQFGLRCQEDLYPQHRQYQQHQQYQQPTPHRHNTWNHASLEQQTSLYQQQSMDPGRPWSFHDIETEARRKSRSRQNSSSSVCSISSSGSNYSHSGYHVPPPPPPPPPPQPVKHQQQQDIQASEHPQHHHDNSINNGAGSAAWRFTASPKPMQATPPPSTAYAMQPPPPLRKADRGPTRAASHADIRHHPRARTLSYSDYPQDHSFSTSYVSHDSSPPPPSTSLWTAQTRRPSSCNSTLSNSGSNAGRGTGRSAPTPTATTGYTTPATTFAIPQEILDPSYRSPTFRIKSWNPPPAPPPTPASSHSTTRAIKITSSSITTNKQALDSWTSSGGAQESVAKSSLWDTTSSEQQEVVSALGTAAVGARNQEVERDQHASADVSTSKNGSSNAPFQFQFSFTSQRFKAVVQASLDREESELLSSSDFLESDTKVTQSLKDNTRCSVTHQSHLFQQLGKHPEPTLTDVSVAMPEDCLATLDDDGAISTATAKDILLYQPNMIKDPPSGVPNGAEELALMVSSMLAPQSNGREGSIQRSAHISPSTPEIQGPTVTFSDLIDVLDKSAMAAPSSPSSLSSVAVASGGTGEVNADMGGLNKTGSWTSLHRLVLKMTKNNEAAVAAVMASLPRSGRMHLEGS